MLNKVNDIEGYEGQYQNDMLDDTPPMGVQTRFFVKAEELPAESAKQNRIIIKNFVYVERRMDLGRSCYARRVRDNVEITEDGKFKVIKLASGARSDILANKDEWNAFARGAASQDIGTPLTLLFSHDPSRIEWYGFYHIRTIERLARLNDADAERLGNGVREDMRRAARYIEVQQKNAESSHLQRELELRDQQINSLTNTVKDLTDKITVLLIEQREQMGIKHNSSSNKRPVGRPRKNQNVEVQSAGEADVIEQPEEPTYFHGDIEGLE